MIKKAESDAVTTVEDANVKSEDLIKDATSKANGSVGGEMTKRLVTNSC